jgi:thymidine phosphorylase
LAAGLQHLVLDVKCGSGAFMSNISEAKALAESLVSVANGAGLKTTALITDMDEPLAPVAGNALEVAHAVKFLRGEQQEPRVLDITLALGAELLVSAGLARNIADARVMLEQSLSSGKAAEHFDKMTLALGGPRDFLRDYQKHLKTAPVIKPLFADGEGVVSSIKTRELGVAVIELGGGRRVASDTINHAVGLDQLAGKGARVNSKTPLCMVHAQSENDFEKAAVIVRAAYVIGDHGASGPNVIERIAVT